ncbi:hypothetical protein [Actinocorallia libanotica]|uniref:30S ribosomal protein S20 n=1 Tax=Actinocorallia libanotica TaxID=46162 RepID=A0ABN1QRZ3_9ACTN
MRNVNTFESRRADKARTLARKQARLLKNLTQANGTEDVQQ